MSELNRNEANTIKVRFPDDAPLYLIFCKGCGEATGGGGFLLDGCTPKDARAYHEKHGVCGQCDAELCIVGCLIRVFDTPDDIRGREFDAFNPKEPT